MSWRVTFDSDRELSLSLFLRRLPDFNVSDTLERKLRALSFPEYYEVLNEAIRRIERETRTKSDEFYKSVLVNVTRPKIFMTLIVGACLKLTEGTDQLDFALMCGFVRGIVSNVLINKGCYMFCFLAHACIEAVIHRKFNNQLKNLEWVAGLQMFCLDTIDAPHGGRLTENAEPSDESYEEYVEMVKGNEELKQYKMIKCKNFFGFIEVNLLYNIYLYLDETQDSFSSALEVEEHVSNSDGSSPDKVEKKNRSGKGKSSPKHPPKKSVSFKEEISSASAAPLLSKLLDKPLEPDDYFLDLFKNTASSSTETFFKEGKGKSSPKHPPKKSVSLKEEKSSAFSVSLLSQLQDKPLKADDICFDFFGHTPSSSIESFSKEVQGKVKSSPKHPPKKSVSLKEEQSSASSAPLSQLLDKPLEADDKFLDFFADTQSSTEPFSEEGQNYESEVSWVAETEKTTEKIAGYESDSDQERTKKSITSSNLQISSQESTPRASTIKEPDVSEAFERFSAERGTESEKEYLKRKCSLRRSGKKRLKEGDPNSAIKSCQKYFGNQRRETTSETSSYLSSTDSASLSTETQAGKSTVHELSYSTPKVDTVHDEKCSYDNLKVSSDGESSVQHVKSSLRLSISPTSDKCLRLDYNEHSPISLETQPVSKEETKQSTLSNKSGSADESLETTLMRKATSVISLDSEDKDKTQKIPCGFTSDDSLLGVSENIQRISLLSKSSGAMITKPISSRSVSKLQEFHLNQPEPVWKETVPTSEKPESEMARKGDQGLSSVSFIQVTSKIHPDARDPATISGNLTSALSKSPSTSTEKTPEETPAQSRVQVSTPPAESVLSDKRERYSDMEEYGPLEGLAASLQHTMYRMAREATKKLSACEMNKGEDLSKSPNVADTVSIVTDTDTSHQSDPKTKSNDDLLRKSLSPAKITKSILRGVITTESSPSRNRMDITKEQLGGHLHAVAGSSSTSTNQAEGLSMECSESMCKFCFKDCYILIQKLIIELKEHFEKAK